MLTGFVQNRAINPLFNIRLTCFIRKLTQRRIEEHHQLFDRRCAQIRLPANNKPTSFAGIPSTKAPKRRREHVALNHK